MNKGTLIALGVLLVLMVVYFATSNEPRQYERAPYTVEHVEGLDRLEITPPKGKGKEADAGAEKAQDSQQKPTLIALEKHEDGWWLTQPVESPASESFSKTIDEVLGESIGTDDLRIDAAQKADYEVDETAGTRLALFAGGDSPKVELIVGKQIEVEGTGAKRTYIREAGSRKIYRAQAGLGDLVDKSVDEMRSDKIVDFDKKSLTRLEFERADGQKIVLKKAEETWKLLSPQVEWELDASEIDSIAGALSGLTASDFADEKSLSEVGLEPPTVRLSVEASGGKKGGGTKRATLLVGEVASDGKSNYYAKLADKPFKYQLSNYAGEKLVATLGDIRSKKPRSFDKKAITEVQFPGEDSVLVRKEGDAWKLVRPDREKPLNQKTLDSKLSTVAALTVKGFPDVEPSEAGLGPGADRVVFETDGGERAILLGDEVDEKSGDRYVKFDDADEVYVVTKYTAQKLVPKADEMVGESSAGRPKGLGKGMGKGMPGGMNRRQKMKIMKKIRQQKRMRNR